MRIYHPIIFFFFQKVIKNSQFGDDTMFQTLDPGSHFITYHIFYPPQLRDKLS